MEESVVITGIGLRSALGDLSQTWQAILAGQTGLRIQQPFPALPPRPLGLLQAQPLTDLTLLTQAVVADALADAQLESPLWDCGVVVGSSRHHQNRWEALARSHGQTPLNPEIQPPLALPPTVREWMQLWPGSSAIAVAQSLQSQGPVLAPMAACATGLWALAQGFELIQMGLCQQVIVATVEAPITPLTLAGFEQAGILAQTGVYPFDLHREGLAIAEGGAAFVLETQRNALARHAIPYGQILGFGLAADAYHMSTPDPQGRGAHLAIQTCLDHSHLQPGDIDYIHTHGTGTPWNDRTESALITQSFPHPPYCSSTKGSTGHTLGASGGLGMAITTMALKQQILPPCVGLRSPEFNLPFVTTALIHPLRNALCFSFGFGGQNAAIAVRQFT